MSSKKKAASEKLIKVDSDKEYRRDAQTEPAVKGWLFRESAVVDNVTNARFGALFAHTFVTYRKETSTNPSKVWILHSRCSVSEVQEQEFIVRHRHKSTLWALAAGHYDKKLLHSFTIQWPDKRREDVKLCFEESDEAHKWRTAFLARLAALQLEQPAGPLDSFSRPSDDAALSVAEATPSSISVVAVSTLKHVQVREAVPSRFSNEDATEDTELGSAHSKGSAPAGAVGPAQLPPRPQRQPNWAKFRHVNGVAVYQEGEGPDGEGGAFMVSAVVRSTPYDCFKALTELDGESADMPFALDAEILETASSHSRVVRGGLRKEGLLGALCAPRELVLQHSWREEDDGTLIMLLKSVNHPLARPDPGQHWWSWYRPVRAQVHAGGVTIAPLQSKYLRDGVSPECLVTMVIKLDLGGWMTQDSAAARLFRPVIGPLAEAYLEPLLMSIITLRDRVEQNRFVVRPFSMGRQSDADHYASPTAKPLPRTVSSFQKRRESASGAPPADVPSADSAAGPAAASTAGAPSVAAASPEGSVEPSWQRGTLDPIFWSCPGGAGYKVRGPTYLKDKKKVLAEEPVFGLASVDLVETDAPAFHVSRHLPSIRDSKAPFTFVVNIMVPGPPFLSLVMAWAADYDPAFPGDSPHHPSGADGGNASPVSHLHVDSVNDGDSDTELSRSPFDVCMARFLAGDDEAAVARRHGTFKLIPSVVKGSWVIKQSVGNTPVLLGQKLTTQYHRGAGYFEVDVDVGSSVAASSVVGLVSGCTKSLVIDMGILLEGHKTDELPERLLGTVRFSHLDLSTAAVLDTTTGKIYRRPAKAGKKK